MQNEINGEFYWRPKIVTEKTNHYQQTKKRKSKTKKFKKEIIEAMIRD
jgi:IS4 transposase